MSWVNAEKRAEQERRQMRLNRQGFESEGDYLWSQRSHKKQESDIDPAYEHEWDGDILIVKLEGDNNEIKK